MNDRVEVLRQFYAALNRYDMQAIVRHFDPQVEARIHGTGSTTPLH